MQPASAAQVQDGQWKDHCLYMPRSGVPHARHRPGPAGGESNGQLLQGAHLSPPTTLALTLLEVDISITVILQ